MCIRDRFRAEHEADILIHQAAKKYFDSLGVGKLPTIKALREEYAEVLEACLLYTSRCV